MKNKLTILIALLLMAFIFTSCDKNKDDNNIAYDENSLEDNFFSIRYSFIDESDNTKFIYLRFIATTSNSLRLYVDDYTGYVEGSVDNKNILITPYNHVYKIKLTLDTNPLIEVVLIDDYYEVGNKGTIFTTVEQKIMLSRYDITNIELSNTLDKVFNINLKEKDKSIIRDYITGKRTEIVVTHN